MRLVTASISGLTITGGNVSVSNGGGLDNYGTTTLTNCTVSGNSATLHGRRRRVQQLRHGHADQLHRQRQLRPYARRRPVQLRGTTTLTNCTVSGNSAIPAAAAAWITPTARPR